MIYHKYIILIYISSNIEEEVLRLLDSWLYNIRINNIFNLKL